MLDFHKLMLQIQGVGKESLEDKFSQEQIAQACSEAYELACRDTDAFAQKLERNLPYVLWPLAAPLEPPGVVRNIDYRREPVTVVATDGSQIMPSHHEIHNCYLLNVGYVVISYGAKASPILETVPRLYHKTEELYPLVDRRRLHIDELYVSSERNLFELETLCLQALEAVNRGLPVVALLDGTLIPWSVEKMPESYQRRYMERVENLMAMLHSARVPVIGYLSHSRSADLVNDLRVLVCPYEVSDCRRMCGHLNEEDFPCSRIWPLSDRQLLSGKLPRASRSAVFQSGANMSRCFKPEQQICFAYVNVGYEIARLEFPRWVFQDGDTLNVALETVMSQVDKGAGYPVALSEAHHLAVIRSADRQQFFDLLAKHLVRMGVDAVKVSPKESRKRKAIV